MPVIWGQRDRVPLLKQTSWASDLHLLYCDPATHSSASLSALWLLAQLLSKGHQWLTILKGETSMVGPSPGRSVTLDLTTCLFSSFLWLWSPGIAFLVLLLPHTSPPPSSLLFSPPSRQPVLDPVVSWYTLLIPSPLTCRGPLKPLPCTPGWHLKLLPGFPWPWTHCT